MNNNEKFPYTIKFIENGKEKMFNRHSNLQKAIDEAIRFFEGYLREKWTFIVDENNNKIWTPINMWEQ